MKIVRDRLGADRAGDDLSGSSSTLFRTARATVAATAVPGNLASQPSGMQLSSGLIGVTLINVPIFASDPRVVVSITSPPVCDYSSVCTQMGSCQLRPAPPWMPGTAVR